jgi:hypothetical protein
MSDDPNTTKPWRYGHRRDHDPETGPHNIQCATPSQTGTRSTSSVTIYHQAPSMGTAVCDTLSVHAVIMVRHHMIDKRTGADG